MIILCVLIFAFIITSDNKPSTLSYIILFLIMFYILYLIYFNYNTSTDTILNDEIDVIIINTDTIE